MNKSLKIGIICYPTYGGSGVVAAELGKQLMIRGHEIHFFSYSLPIRLNTYQDRIFFHEVSWMDYPLFEHSLYSLALSAKLVEIASLYHLDIIHAHYALPHAISAVLAKNILMDEKIKIVTTLHGTDITLVGIDASFFPITKYGIEKSDAVTCISNFLTDLTKNRFAINKNIHTIYNFIDTNEFIPGDKKITCPMFSKSKYFLIHISNFRPIKRILDVIKVFEIVQKELGDVCLLMVGDGEERSKAERYALERGLLDKIHFLGKQLNIIELLQSSDILLLPSQLESFGLVALEAMSCGVPVVATRTGGIPEVVIHGKTGFLAEVGDISQMAKYCIDIVKNPDLKLTLSKNSRQVAISSFDAKIIIPKYEELYFSLF